MTRNENSKENYASSKEWHLCNNLHNKAFINYNDIIYVFSRRLTNQGRTEENKIQKYPKPIPKT